MFIRRKYIIGIFSCQIIFILICLFIFSCRDNPKPPRISNAKKALILIPGFKGSYLLNSDNEKIWINSYQAILGGETLLLRNPELGFNTPVLHAGGILREVSLVPYIYSKVIYKIFVETIKEKLGDETELYEFSYDWRQEVSGSAESLAKFINELERKNFEEIDIVGHSLGGVIAAYYLRYGGQNIKNAKETWEGAAKIKKVIFAGAPFKGSVEIFDDMQLGARTGLNRSLLTGEAHSSFPSSYELLPRPEDKMFLPDETLSVYNVDNWISNKWGLFRVEEQTSEEIQKRKLFTEEALSNAQKLSSLINSTSQTAPITRILNIVGKNRKTATHFTWDKNNPANNLEKSGFSDGDQIVTVFSADTPPAYRYGSLKELSVDSLHSEILSEEPAISAIADFLEEPSYALLKSNNALK